jgi:hypothetical protein
MQINPVKDPQQRVLGLNPYWRKHSEADTSRKVGIGSLPDKGFNFLLNQGLVRGMQPTKSQLWQSMVTTLRSSCSQYGEATKRSI